MGCGEAFTIGALTERERRRRYWLQWSSLGRSAEKKLGVVFIVFI
jgi:hypothetical protein